MQQVLDRSDVQVQPSNYAGFWIRVGAYFIDSLILGIIFFLFGILFALLSDLFMISSVGTGDELSSDGFLYFAVGSIAFLYFALMESSSKQASIGKIALGLKVVGMNGERITFLNALGRTLAKILSGLIFYTGLSWSLLVIQNKDCMID